MPIPDRKLYRTRWTGDRNTIVGLLQSLNLKIDRTNELLEQNNLYQSMIVDNTNCACEQLKIISDILKDGQKPPVQTYPLLSYAEKTVHAFEFGSSHSVIYFSVPVKSFDASNNPVDFVITNAPASWIDSPAVRKLDGSSSTNDAELISQGYTHVVSFGVVNDGAVPESTTIDIKQNTTGLTDTLTITRYRGLNPDAYSLKYSSGRDFYTHTFQGKAYNSSPSAESIVSLDPDGVPLGWNIDKTGLPAWLQVDKEASTNEVLMTLSFNNTGLRRVWVGWIVQERTNKRIQFTVEQEPQAVNNYSLTLRNTSGTAGSSWIDCKITNAADGSSLVYQSYRIDAGESVVIPLPNAPDELSIVVSNYRVNGVQRNFSGVNSSGSWWSSPVNGGTQITAIARSSNQYNTIEFF